MCAVLDWQDGHVWCGQLRLPPGEHELKNLVITSDGSPLEWEGGPNRTFTVSAWHVLCQLRALRLQRPAVSGAARMAPGCRRRLQPGMLLTCWRPVQIEQGAQAVELDCSWGQETTVTATQVCPLSCVEAAHHAPRLHCCTNACPTPAALQGAAPAGSGNRTLHVQA